eukprot:GFYU01009536.1.p1 GENE.GFYU01009536.1~~GFYU01009536.1.p1  ORF type:complete len:1251 (-),score=260.36 GFYU01009536.1:274-4026(-)
MWLRWRESLTHSRVEMMTCSFNLQAVLCVLLLSFSCSVDASKILKGTFGGAQILPAENPTECGDFICHTWQSPPTCEGTGSPCARNSWIQSDNPFNTPWITGTSVVNVNGFVTLFGGKYSNGDITGGIRSLADRDKAWAWTVPNGPQYPEVRMNHAAGTFRDRYMIVHGGMSFKSIPLNDTWIYDALNNQWTMIATDNGPHRYHHSMHVEQDNTGVFRLLLFGGQFSDSSLGTADTFIATLTVNQPSTTWQVIPESDTSPPPRFQHAHAYYDGSFYIYGGTTGTERLSDTWVLTLPSKQWRQVKPSNEPVARYGMASAVSGKTWYVFGGITDPHTFLKDMWSFDFGSQQWSKLQGIAPFALTPRAFAGMITLRDHKLGLLGGVIDTMSGTADDMWIFDVLKGAWIKHETTLPVPGSRYGHSAVLWNEDAILMFGGDKDDATSTPAETWKYDTVLKHWEAVTVPNTGGSHTPSRRSHHSAVMMDSERKMVVFGGKLHNMWTPSIDETWILDIHNWPVVSPSWTRLNFTKDQDPVQSGGIVIRKPTPMARYGHAAIALNSTTMLMFGGTNDDQIFGDSWLFNINTMAWRLLHDEDTTGKHAPPARTGHSMVMLEKDDRQHIVLVGGLTQTSGGSDDSILWMFDVQYLNWTRIATTNPTPNRRYYHSAAGMGTKMIVFGGIDTVHQTVTYDTFHYDILQGKWTLVGQTSGQPGGPPARSQLAMISLPDSKQVFMFGGRGLDNRPLQDLWNVWPACYPGTAAKDFVTDSCTPCDTGYYAEFHGATECFHCLGDATTPRTGSVYVRDCSICRPEICVHGSCGLSNFEAVCICDFGYFSYDQCTVPWAFMIIGVSVVVVLALFSYKMRAIYQNISMDLTLREYLLDKQGEHVTRLTSVWNIDESEIQLERRIDEDCAGGYGEVWLGIWRDMHVAVKKLRDYPLLMTKTEGSSSFDEEIQFMMQVRHPNIILFYGAGMENGRKFIVIEYMPRGPLSSILSDSTIPLDLETKLRFLLDIARGMQFLHSSEPPRLHRDLKTANLLVSQSFVVKIADFGTAKASSNEDLPMLHKGSITSRKGSNPLGSGRNINSTKGSSRQMTSGVGTLCWTAPELLQSDGKVEFSTKIDVYSFGIVMWEMMTRAEPYPDYQYARDVEKAVLRGERPEIPVGAPKPYVSLMQACWDQEPSKRPSFDYIVLELSRQLNASRKLYASPSSGPSLLTQLLGASGHTPIGANRNLRPSDASTSIGSLSSGGVMW